jgi:hypothetical protein
MGPSCPERLDWDFLEYVWSFPSHSRPKIIRSLEKFAAGQRTIVLRWPADVDRFLNMLELEVSCRYDKP